MSLLHVRRSGTPAGRKRSFRRSSDNQRRKIKEKNDAKKTTSFSIDDLNELQQIFDFYDVHCSKAIDIGELEKAVTTFGLRVQPAAMKKLVLVLNVDGDTTIDFSEFCMVIEHIKDEMGEFGELREAFKCLDLDNNGYVCTADLIDMMITKSDRMTLKEVTEMIRFCDKRNIGKVTYSDFIESLKQFKSELSFRKSSTQLQGSSNYYSCGDKGTEMDERNDKDLKNEKKVSCCNPRNVENVDTTTKAFLGPILLVSSVIINHGK